MSENIMCVRKMSALCEGKISLQKMLFEMLFANFSFAAIPVFTRMCGPILPV